MNTADRVEFALTMRRRAFVARCVAVALAAVPWGFAVYGALQSVGGMR